MRIAMMTNNYKPFIGGVPVSIERLSEGLRKLGHEVCIFAPEYKEAEPEEDVIRYRSGTRRLENGMVMPKVLDRRITEEFEYRDFDLIHVHQPMLVGNAAYYYSKKYGIPLVFTYHTRYEEYVHYLPFFSGLSDTDSVKKYLYGKSQKVVPWYLDTYARHCDLVFAPSGEMKNYMLRRGMDTPVRVLPTGLSPEAYEENPEKKKKIREQFLGEKKYLLCTVSRVEKEKNLYFLIDAAEQLKKQMGDTFRLMIVGDGKEKELLERYAQAKGLEDTVLFAGAVPNEEVRDYVGAADLFVFSSKSETQGIVMAEAMAAGIPVAAIRACGVCDIVKDGINGRLTGENLQDYTGAVKEVLEKEELQKRLGKGARKTAESYRMEDVARRAEEGYVMVLERERRKQIYGYETYGKSHTVSSILRLFKVS